MGVVLMSKRELNRIDVLAAVLATPGARRFHGLNGRVKRPISNQAGLGRFCLGRYFASKPVKSLALEQRISSICRARTSALALSASIFDASGCFFSSSSIRLLNEASSRRRCSIYALLFTGPTVFQTLCAAMMRSPALSRLREPESWPEMEALLARI